MVVLSENEPPKIIMAPRPVRTFVVVPAVTGQPFQSAETILAEGRLNVGEVRYRQSGLPAGSVIDQDPNAGAVARSGTAVKLTLAIARAQARVPNVVGKGLVAAKIALRISGLRPGNVTYRSVPGVTIPRVGSQSYTAGGMVALGTSVDLVVDNPSAKVRVPAITGKRYADALQDLHGAGLRVSGFSSRQHATVQRGHVVSQSPFAGSLVDPGSGVSVVLSAGGGKVAVPYVTGQTPASAIGELARSGLRPTVEYRAMAGIPGRVASQTPSSGTMVDRGSVVSLVVRKALPAVLRITVPDVKGKLPGEAKAILTAAGLALGTVSQGPGRPGRVVSQSPSSGMSVSRGTSVALVVGRIVVAPVLRVTVPNVVGLQEGAAGAALRRVGLEVGTVSKISGARPGNILRQSPGAGTRVVRGSKVNLTVTTRTGVVLRTTVPNLIGQQEAAARATLGRYGLQVGTVTKVPGLKDGDVLKQSPSAGARVPRGSKVDLTVSTRRITSARVPVPNVVGMQEAAAGAALRRVGLQVGAVTKLAGAKEGDVLKQSPPAGFRVARGSRVNLTVSTRRITAARVSVPNVVGMQEGAAGAALRRVGLQVGTVSKIPGWKDGDVVKQSPSVGARVARGSKVNLTVSTKRTTAIRVRVPSVVGMQEGAAGAALRRVGLQVGTVSKAPGAVPGRILKQSPSAGASVARGSKINITVAERRAIGPPRPPTPGKPLVTVPNVVGMSLGQARMALRKVELDVGTISRKKVPGARRGRIASQTPAAGTKAAKGTKVNLVFAF
jgi:beta-lactam-binding protein with PASTA domain